MTTSSRLFALRFSARLTRRDIETLNAELGFVLTDGDPRREFAEASLGDYADVYLSRGDEEDSWVFEALAAPGQPVDSAAVARMEAALREFIAGVASGERDV